MALGAGEHIALDGARFQAHRAGVFARRIAITAQLGALAVETHHQCLAVRHPDETLGDTKGAAEAAKQMACQGKLNDE